MTLSRWDPFKELVRIEEKMARLMETTSDDSIFGRWGLWNINVDVLETPDCYIFRADIPGVSKDKIDIQIRGARLTIQGERTADPYQGSAEYLSIERETGLFERSFNLPGNVSVERAEASYENGVLEIILPKSKDEAFSEIRVVCVG
jgi:HSP20 family protein